MRRRSDSSGSVGEVTPVTHNWVVNEAAGRRLPPLGMRQLWRHRELIGFFALRDVRVRYKQAFLGFAWAGLQPLVGALTFTIVFHRLASVEISGASYFAFAVAGFGAWTYFSGAVQSGAGSLLANAELLTKVAFARIVPPVAALLPNLIDLSVALVLAAVVNAVAGGGFSAIHLLLGLPLGIVLLVLAAAGPALLLGTTIVRYRDASALLTFGLQFSLFVTPIAYPPEFVPEGWRTVLFVNPLAGALGLIRAALVDERLPSAGNVLLSSSVAVVLFLAGLVHFRRREREFADII